MSVGEVIDQPQAEVLFGAKSGGRHAEQQQAEVEVHQVGLFGHVRLDVSHPFSYVLDTALK